MNIIYHLVAADYWHGLDPTEPYLPDGFDEDGFIHCTRGVDLLLHAANTIYQDAPGDVLLLVIDEGCVSAEVKYENGFPHIYGPLNRDAIVALHTMIRHEERRFDLPNEISKPPRR